MSVLALLLATALTGATVGVHIEEIGELPLETGIAIAQELARSVERTTGAHAVLDDPSWATCERDDRCAIEIKARTGADELVFVRVLAGLTMIRVVAERSTAGPAVHAEADVAADRAGWPKSLDAVARALFPGVQPLLQANTASTAAPLAARIEREGERMSILPWIAFGAAAAATAAAIGFGSSNRSAREELESGIFLEPRYRELESRAHDHGLAADVFAGTAIVAVVSGVVLLITD